MPRYSHILFDHDGVLVDTERLYFQATRTKLAELGVELELDRYLRLQVESGSTWDLARAAGASEAQVKDQRDARNALYQELVSSEDIAIPGVEALLKELAPRCRMAIVTTSRQEDFDLIHRDLHIVPYMDFVLTRRDYTHSKPHPEPYLTALARFGLEPADALVVEDTERGLRAAVAAGIDCATVHHPLTASQDFSRATYRIDDLQALLGILDGT